VAELHDIRAALDEARDALFGKPNVVATGVGFKVSEGVRTATLSIVCSVVEKRPLAALSAREVVPRDIAGIPTDVVATGVLRTLNAPTARFRPAPGGVSVGHRDITAGTLGCLVRRNGDVFILSNNHVLANSNFAHAGDAILQPGPVDGGRDPEDRIATLESFVPVITAEEQSECAFANSVAHVANAAARLLGSDARLRAISTQAVDNLVDAAIARPVSPEVVSEGILGVGTITGVSRAMLGMSLIKSGRTTGVTTGEIEQVDVTADVQYGQRVARFTDQVMAGAMSQGGDSGSAVLDSEHRIVGLLFAGSDTTTVINRIEHVFAALDVGL
jgi:hypothetical protein